jgi:hypothetical protein
MGASDSKGIAKEKAAGKYKLMPGQHRRGADQATAR